MNKSEEPIRLIGSEIGPLRHICGFFRNQEEEYRALLPIMKEGIERGEKAFHIVNPVFREEHRRYLHSGGIAVEELEQTGQLEIHDWDETYLRGGRFNPDVMLNFIEEILQRGKSEGFPRTRVVGQMEWLPEDRPGVNDLVEYEARLHHLLAKYDDMVVCTYCVSKFGAGVMLDLIRIHPVAIISGILHENPYFVSPDDFLKELRSRVHPAVDC
jgi:hypothetical protein